jgi:hypothetical protein
MRAKSGVTGTKTRPQWLQYPAIFSSMVNMLSLKYLLDALHARLAAAPKLHPRSLNNQAILCVTPALGVPAASVEDE